VLITLAILLDGIVFASYLFLVSIGLTLIFGVMKILNAAHGSFYAFGAYSSATVLGLYFTADRPMVGALALMLAAAVGIGTILGLVLERGLLRPFQGRDEVLIVLVTYAVSLMLEDIITLIWGTGSLSAYQPLVKAGNFAIGPLTVSVYDLGLVVLAIAIAVAGWWALRHTRWGYILTAVIHDREMAASFGVNVTRVFTWTFVLGAILGALGGAVMAPKISVTLGIGIEVIVLAFAVVAIGGLGSVEGAMIGALIVGLARAASVQLFPQVELFVIYAVMALVLAFRPLGLFTRAQARKI
jgi:branched-chain amino acid transport system permease protein